MSLPSQKCQKLSHVPLGLSVEPLERRCMLAGNVSATINASGDLLIRGDAADNELRITIDTVGNVDLVALDGTTSFDLGNLLTSRMTGDVRVDTRGGSDRVELVSLNGPPPVDNVVIRTGAGNDRVRMDVFDASGSISLNMAGGNDVFVVREVVSSGLQVQTGTGADSLDLVTFFPEEFDANLGAGDDEFLIEETSGKLRLNSGSGNDFIGLTDITGFDAVVRTGGGGDSLDLEYVNGIRINIATGAGIDDMIVEHSDVTGELIVNTGGGDDEIEFKYADAANAHINMGGGNDYLGINQSQLDQLEMVLGGGNDFGSLFELNSSTNANGGGGFDELRVVSGADLDLELRSIEELS